MRRLKKRKIFTKNQKKRSEDGRVLAAGRFHLPAVAMYWLMESCGVWYEKMVGGLVLLWPVKPGRNVG